MAMGGDGRVIIDTELDDKGLSQGMDGFSGKLGKFVIFRVSYVDFAPDARYYWYEM